MSILWGSLVFHERVRGGWFIALAVVSCTVMASAVVVLARSPLLAGKSAQAEEEQSVENGDEPEDAVGRVSQAHRSGER